LWALYGAYLGNEYGLHQGDWTTFVYESCIDSAQQRAVNDQYSKPAQEQHAIDNAACEQSRDRDWRASIQYHWQYAAFVGLVPIPLGWLFVYGVIKLVRWISDGFKSSENQAE